jgi:hypothetical protein
LALSTLYPTFVPGFPALGKVLSACRGSSPAGMMNGRIAWLLDAQAIDPARTNPLESNVPKIETMNPYFG